MCRGFRFFCLRDCGLRFCGWRLAVCGCGFRMVVFLRGWSFVVDGFCFVVCGLMFAALWFCGLWFGV